MDDTTYLESLQASFLIFLDRLKENLLAYSDETVLWRTADGISNSAGTLAVHLIGNLNHYIGATLGDTGYVRDRPLEFSIRDKPRDEIIADIESTRRMIAGVIPTLTHEVLHGVYPIRFGDVTPTTLAWLIECNTHFAYHLGQINYHRRLLDR